MANEPDASLAPVVGGMLVLTSLIAVVLAVITWSTGTGKWFLAGAAAMMAGGVALIARSSASTS